MLITINPVLLTNGETQGNRGYRIAIRTVKLSNARPDPILSLHVFWGIVRHSWEALSFPVVIPYIVRDTMPGSIKIRVTWAIPDTTLAKNLGSNFLSRVSVLIVPSGFDIRIVSDWDRSIGVNQPGKLRLTGPHYWAFFSKTINLFSLYNYFWRGKRESPGLVDYFFNDLES